MISNLGSNGMAVLLRLINITLKTGHSKHSNMYRWIKNFLTDSTIATQIEGVTSTKECLKEGIPQGRSLSCTLFTLYINDIVKYLPDTYTALYADDLVLWSTSANMYSVQANVNTSLRRDTER